MSVKDLFSEHAALYAQYRPRYPRELFDFLTEQVNEHSCAWDCATGNGQAAIMLADYFPRVIATDLSSEQILYAAKHPRVTYYVANAYESKIAPETVDLITVAQAFHWLSPDLFAAEVKRVAKPKAVLAIWCYGLVSFTPAIDKLIHNLYDVILNGYWEPERKLLDVYYEGVSLPFKELYSPHFFMTAHWSLAHLMGYLRTWSALRKYLLTNKDPMPKLEQQIKALWGKAEIHQARWQLRPKLWRI
jgi:SAM-dependent methyltransferase